MFWTMTLPWIGGGLLVFATLAALFPRFRAFFLLQDRPQIMRHSYAYWQSKPPSNRQQARERWNWRDRELDRIWSIEPPDNAD